MPFEFVFLIVSKMLFSLVGLGIVVWGVLAYTRAKNPGRVSGVTDPGALASIDERLKALEVSNESIALQVERIAEGQRFVTKLLGDAGAVKGSTPQKILEQHHT
ncbi:MAG TPA: hypothetical protein VIG47_09380 [Gemmatimonadaceae bacterium]